MLADDDVCTPRLLESLTILECYRVLIMQRPPLFPWGYKSFISRGPTDGSESRCLLDLFRAIIIPDSVVDASAMKKYSLASLASLACFLWPAAPLPLAEELDGGVSNPGIWKADFVGLACDSWLREQAPDVNPSSIILYHLVNIALHSNFGLLRIFAHPQAGPATCDSNRNATSKLIRVWAQSIHHDIAKGHAEALLSCAENALNVSFMSTTQEGNRFQQGLSTDSSLSCRLFPLSGLPAPTLESPHVPYAVYYATLVLWCGAAVLNEGPVPGNYYLIRGSQILSRQRIRIAHLLDCLIKGIK